MAARDNSDLTLPESGTSKKSLSWKSKAALAVSLGIPTAVLGMASTAAADPGLHGSSYDDEGGGTDRSTGRDRSPAPSSEDHNDGPSRSARRSTPRKTAADRSPVPPRVNVAEGSSVSKGPAGDAIGVGGGSLSAGRDGSNGTIGVRSATSPAAPAAGNATPTYDPNGPITVRRITPTPTPALDPGPANSNGDNAKPATTSPAAPAQADDSDFDIRDVGMTEPVSVGGGSVSQIAPDLVVVELTDGDDTFSVRQVDRQQMLTVNGEEIAVPADADLYVDGKNGNDKLRGGENDDILVGGAGIDDLHGGGGTDDLFPSDERPSLRKQAANAPTVTPRDPSDPPTPAPKFVEAEVAPEPVAAVSAPDVQITSGPTVHLNDGVLLPKPRAAVKPVRSGVHVGPNKIVVIGTDADDTVAADGNTIEVNGGRTTLTAEQMTAEDGSAKQIVYAAGAGNDSITSAGEHNDFVVVGDADSADANDLDLGGGADSVFGKDGDHNLVGTTGDKFVSLRDGDQNIKFRGGFFKETGDVFVEVGNGDSNIRVGGWFSSAGELSEVIGGNGAKDINIGSRWLRNGGPAHVRLNGSEGGEGGEGSLIKTTNSDDIVVGTLGSDTIYTYDGADKIKSPGGDNEVFSGSGPDKVRTGDGDDWVMAGNGDDSVETGLGNDDAFGQEGDDRLALGPGDDEGYGGAGNDTIYGESGNDVLDGDRGDDQLYGDADKPAPPGYEGDDRLVGGFGSDRLRGGYKTDNKGDFLDGGSGADEYRLAGGELVTETPSTDQLEYFDPEQFQNAAADRTKNNAYLTVSWQLVDHVRHKMNGEPPTRDAYFEDGIGQVPEPITTRITDNGRGKHRVNRDILVRGTDGKLRRMSLHGGTVHG